MRLRRDLADASPLPVWPFGFRLETFHAGDAPAVHALLASVFTDEPNFEDWWQARSNDAEFEPALVFLVRSDEGQLAAVAWCWASAFVKDLAVAHAARRKGLAEALMLHVFSVFRARGAGRVDLKTNTIANADAYRLYQRLGMVQVAWGG